MENNSDYIIEDGILYKTCPSCHLRCGKRVYYECPKYFGYRGIIIQSQCNKCRGKGKTEPVPFEGGRFFDDDYFSIKEVRILPMTKEGLLPTTDIKEFFCEEMVDRDNVYYYKRNSMNVEKGTLVFFQFEAKIVAYGIYEYSSTDINDKTILEEGYQGFYKFYNDSIVFLDKPISNKELKENLEISLNQTTQRIALSKLPRLFEMAENKEPLVVSDYVEEYQYDVNEINIKKIQVVDKFHILGVHNSIIRKEKNSILTLDDYKKEQERKSNIGNIGEELILEFEKEKLKKLELNELAEKVKRVSLENSHLGYDILSYNEKGEEIHIEVKAKAQNINYIDFYLTGNEYENLLKSENNFIYYISKIRSSSPKLFILNKDKIDKENLRVVLYKVSVDYKEDEIL